jgi:NADP-dependent 3-hydroxy acid dehydrogenase YdfG
MNERTGQVALVTGASLGVGFATLPALLGRTSAANIAG